MSKSKKDLDRELNAQTATQWELDHESKRTTEYVERIAQMKVDIVALQERIPKNGIFFVEYPNKHKHSYIRVYGCFWHCLMRW